MRGTRLRQWAVALAVLAVAPATGRAQAPSPDTRPTIAVLYFNATAMVNRDEYAPLDKGIAELLITELAANPNVRVVEREHLQQILDEQNLGAGGRVDKETAVRLGRLLGARYMITGGFVVDQRHTMRLDARVFNVETSEIRREDVWTVTGKADDVFALVSEMGEKVRNGLRLPAVVPAAGRSGPGGEQGSASPASTGPSRATRPTARDSAWTPSRAVATTAVTKDVDQRKATILFSRAIQARDRGDMAAARRYYEEALALYPDFGRAKVLNASLDRPTAGS